MTYGMACEVYDELARSGFSHGIDCSFQRVEGPQIGPLADDDRDFVVRVTPVASTREAFARVRRLFPELECIGNGSGTFTFTDKV